MFLLILLICLMIQSKSIRLSLIFLALFLIIYGILKALCHENRLIKFPSHVEDVAKGIEWVYSNVHNYGGNKDKICILAHSAGAALASLVTLNRRFLNQYPHIPEKVIKGVIAISGPYSFWRMQESSARHLINNNVFGIKSDLDPKTLENIQPCDQDYEQWSRITDSWCNFFEHSMSPQTTPPYLLLTSGIDLSLLRHARDFADMFKRQNCYGKTIHFPSTTHFSIRSRWGKENSEIGDVVCKFLAVVNE